MKKPWLHTLFSRLNVAAASPSGSLYSTYHRPPELTTFCLSIFETTSIIKAKSKLIIMVKPHLQ
ncbi:hypothetical protein Hanom_Chr06g00556011 [Helianthus anomalus]